MRSRRTKSCGRRSSTSSASLPFLLPRSRRRRSRPSSKACCCCTCSNTSMRNWPFARRWRSWAPLPMRALARRRQHARPQGREGGWELFARGFAQATAGDAAGAEKSLGELRTLNAITPVPDEAPSTAKYLQLMEGMLDGSIKQARGETLGARGRCRAARRRWPPAASRRRATRTTPSLAARTRARPGAPVAQSAGRLRGRTGATTRAGHSLAVARGPRNERPAHHCALSAGPRSCFAA